MLMYFEQKQPLYGVIGIMVVLFASAVALWIYMTS